MEWVKKVWADPVWSKVIATGIVAILSATLYWGWDLLTANAALVAASITSPLFWLPGLVLVAVAIYFPAKKVNKRRQLRALIPKYESNELFRKIFMSEEPIKNAVQTYSHLPRYRYLIDNLSADRLLVEAPDPVLNSRGKQLLEQMKKNL